MIERHLAYVPASSSEVVAFPESATLEIGKPTRKPSIFALKPKASNRFHGVIPVRESWLGWSLGLMWEELLVSGDTRAPRLRRLGLRSESCNVTRWTQKRCSRWPSNHAPELNKQESGRNSAKFSRPSRAMFEVLLPFRDMVFKGCWPKAVLPRWQPFKLHDRRPPSFIGASELPGVGYMKLRRGQQKPAFHFLRGWLWLADTALRP